MLSPKTKRHDPNLSQSARKLRLTSLSSLFQSRRTDFGDAEQTSRNLHLDNYTMTPHPSRDVLPRGITVPDLHAFPTVEVPRLYKDKPKDRFHNKANFLTRLPVAAPNISPLKNRSGIRSPRKLPKAHSSHDIIAGYSPQVQKQNAMPMLRQSREASHEVVRQSFEMIFPAAPNSSPRSKQSLIPSPVKFARADRSLNVPQNAQAISLRDSPVESIDMFGVEKDCNMQSTGHPDELQQPPLSPDVYDAQPSAYWSGRFSTLDDMYRALDNTNPILADTEELSIEIASADVARVRKVCARLYECCKTEVARTSFASFMTRYAVNNDMPEIPSLLIQLRGGNTRSKTYELAMKVKRKAGIKFPIR